MTTRGDFWNSVADLLGLALLAAGTFFFRRLKKWFQERKARSFDLSINRSAKVQALLSELRPVMDADRIELFQLHNGEYFLSGESNMKCSLTHFYVRTGIAMPMYEQRQSIPTSHFSNLFHCLRGASECHYPHDGEEFDAAFRRMLNLSGSKTAYIVPVMKKKDVWVGFLIISWIEDNQPITPAMKGAVIDYAQQIADQLTTS